MPGIAEFPSLVQNAIKRFGHLFANEPERVHFGECLTGLLVASRKTVTSINAEFAMTTDRSCLNRWITQVGWDPERLNGARLAWHQKATSTRYSRQGVIAIDNVLIDHDGKCIEDVGWFWDHADKKNKIAHDYLIANYVCTSGTQTFHPDGKQHLGLGDCQLRSGEGQTRHMYPVILAHSLLVAELRQGCARESARNVAATIGEACRSSLREVLSKTIAWAIDRATNHNWDHERITAILALS